MKQSIQARHMARRQRRGSGTAKLNLVSLMDIFTILVFFLLVNSSDVEILQSNKDIKLPEAIANQKPDEMVVVMVSGTDILVGGRQVVSVADVLNTAGVIEPLSEELKYLAERRPYRDDAERAEGRDVTIMGDAAIPYTLLKKIMTTCANAEFRNISLAVSQIPASQPVTAVGG